MLTTDDAGASLMPIFATPFASMTLDVPQRLNDELAQLFEQRATPQNRDPQSPPNTLLFRSRDNLLEWPDAPVQELRRHLLTSIASIVAALNIYSEAEFEELQMQARSWYSLLRPDGAISAANFFGTSWCAIYCVAAPELLPGRQHSGVLRLYETRLGTAFMDASNWRLRSPFGPAHHTWRPFAGGLALFPATVLHEIALLKATSTLTLVTTRVRFAAPTQESLPQW